MVKILSIEGNIGSGKSTLVRILKEKYPNIVFLQEPVDEWMSITDKNGENILEKFYKDQKKYAFPFQLMAYISRIAQLQRTNADLIICERCVLTDRHVFAQMLYDKGMMEKIHWEIYNKWFDHFNIRIDGHIYIKTFPFTCQKRIIERKREGERIELTYLENCNAYHDKWLQDKKNVLELDGELSFHEEEGIVEGWMKRINSFIGDIRTCEKIPAPFETWKEILW